MIYKYYTADCIQLIENVGSFKVGNCIVKLFIWQSAEVAYSRLSSGAKDNGVKLINFRRVN